MLHFLFCNASSYYNPFFPSVNPPLKKLFMFHKTLGTGIVTAFVPDRIAAEAPKTAAPSS